MVGELSAAAGGTTSAAAGGTTSAAAGRAASGAVNSKDFNKGIGNIINAINGANGNSGNSKSKNTGTGKAKELMDKKFIDAMMSGNEAMMAIAAAGKIVVDGINKVASAIEDFGSGLAEIRDGLSSFGKDFQKAEKQVYDFGKKLGISGKNLEKYSENIVDTVVDYNLARDFGWGAGEMMKFRSSYTEQLGGRAVDINGEGYQSAAAMSNLMGSNESASEFIGKLEKFGISLPEAGEKAAEMYKEAAKAGLSFEKYSKNVAKNLDLVQKITFRNGIKGLEDMVKKSMEIGLNIKEAAQLSEKLMDGGVEAATEMGAKLQVLGGSFAQLSNPLELLNEGLNGAEDLQNRIGKMVENMGHFNRETGQIEISAFDKMRLKGASKAMGVSYEELTSSATRQALRGEIGRQLEQGGFNGNSELVELLKNTGVIQNGVAGANINGKFYGADEIAASSKLQEELLVQSKTEGENIADIAKSTRSIADYVIYNKKNDEVHTQKYEKNTTANIGRWAGRAFNKNFYSGMIGASKAVSNANASAGQVFGGVEKIGNIFKSSPVSMNGGINSFGDGGKVDGLKRFDSGGIAVGPSHDNGGIKGITKDGFGFEFEGGEYITNKKKSNDSVYGPFVAKVNEDDDFFNAFKDLLNSGGYIKGTNIEKFETGGTIGQSGEVKLNNKYVEQLQSIGAKISSGGFETNKINIPSIEKINENTNSIKIEANQERTPVKVEERPTSTIREDSKRENSSIKIDPIDINVNGTLTLTAPNGQMFNYSNILKEPLVMREISKVITDILKNTQVKARL